MLVYGRRGIIEDNVRIYDIISVLYLLSSNVHGDIVELYY